MMTNLEIAQLVADLDIEYQAAVERNDPETMGRILADDFVLITGLGKVYSRDDLLDEARAGSTVYDHQEAEQRRVRTWGDTAVVTALLRAKGAQNGKSFEYKLWYSDTYVKLDDEWRYVFGQASTRLSDTP